MMGKLRAAFLVIFIVGLVGCDHATKRVAVERLSGRGPVSLVADVLELQYAENRDTAFSLTRGVDMAGKQQLLGLLALLGCAVAAGVAWRRRRVASGLEQAGLGLVVAGGLGNGLDRLAHGHVVDFIHLQHWPIFNVADILVVAGAVALVLATRKKARQGGDTPPVSAGSA